MTGAGGDCRRRHVDTVSSTIASPSTYLERNHMPIVAATSGLEGWADLPDGLLQSIVSLLVSFPDLVAFAATCLSWRAAFSSYPSKFSFSTLLPPLLLRSDVPMCSPCPRPFSSSLVPRRACHITDLANQNVYMSCQIPLFCRFDGNGPPSPLDKFKFNGAFYGHLILTNERSCLVVDVVTGSSVSPPQLQVDKYSQSFYGMLTAPLASPTSHLLLSSGSCHFSWRVGSNSWSEPFGPLNQIVAFKDKVFGMHFSRGLFILHLVPQIFMQKIVFDEISISETRHLYFKWLVACGDMLLMVFQSSHNTFEAFCLDLTTEPAKWVKVKKLENWAIFISIDQRTQPLCCMNPERWGGRSNCVYCCFEDSKGWMAFELGESLTPLFMHCPSNMQPMWVVPSMFSSCQ